MSQGSSAAPGNAPARRGRLRIDWGHLLVATAALGGVLAYILDARSVSLSLNNLLLVQPVAIFAVILYLLIVPQFFWREGTVEAPVTSKPSGAPVEETGGLWRVFALAVAFGLFVLGLETVGFDISAWAFTLVALVLGGERRPLVLLIFPVVFAVAVILLFQQMMPYPMTTLVL